jgi:farnesyl-diphosphate farnesyltransferase
MRPVNTPLLTALLREVSRSFYLTLRWLPGTVRSQIGLAYLLARATDTIADTELVPVEQRLDALAALRERILGTATQPLAFVALAQRQGTTSERQLLERIEDAIAILTALSAADRQLIRDALRTIIGGQELDLRRFTGASGDVIVALRTDDELDDYTYRVAGCVGEFWTRMCRAHLFPRAPLDESCLLADSVRFGKGLQLVNILRDLPADLRQGRCYLPELELGKHGLKPSDLLKPEAQPAFRPYYESLLDRAEAHLRAGWGYTNQLPRGCVRVRLVCAWPILIGVQTLARLRQQKILNASQRIKISRADVRGIVLHSLIAYPWPAAWNSLYARTASR